MINKSAESPVLGNLKAFRPVLQPLTALNMKPPFPIQVMRVDMLTCVEVTASMKHKQEEEVSQFFYRQ